MKAKFIISYEIKCDAEDKESFDEFIEDGDITSLLECFDRNSAEVQYSVVYKEA